jgi:hypothetical protein
MTQAQAHPVMHRLLLDLERLGRRARWLLVARAVAVGLGSIVGGIALVAVLDWMVRFPGWLRGTFGGDHRLAAKAFRAGAGLPPDRD